MYRFVVQTDSTDLYAKNAQTFDTAEQARNAATSLFMRWTSVKAYAVMPVAIVPDVDGSYFSVETVKQHEVIE
jgi:hypothetical protein